MDEYTKQLIANARDTYEDVLTGSGSRIVRGSVLWDQFEQAATNCAADKAGAERQLGERINELAVAKVLADIADKVEQYKGGKEALFGFFVGQTMKAMQGKANPQLVNEALRKALSA